MMRFRRTGMYPGRISTLTRVAAAARIGRAARTYLFQKRRKNVKSGAGITTQHDVRRVYQKRYMPKKKRRRWGGFIRKVNAVSEKELGARQVVFNKLVTKTNTDATKHIVQSLYLYGQKSDSTYASDMVWISSFENKTDPTAAAGVTVDDSSKYLFQSAVLDITVCNHSGIIAAGGVVEARSAAKMEVDVYEIAVRKQAAEYDTIFQDLEAMLNDNTSRTKIIGTQDAGESEISYDLRGVTPFELSYSLSRWGIKIMKKTKYMLPNQETFTYQVRDPRRHSINRRDMDQMTGFNRPGWTRIVLFIGKLVPGVAVGSTEGFYKEVLDFGVTRKYLYKLEGVQDDRTMYKTQ